MLVKETLNTRLAIIVKEVDTSPFLRPIAFKSRSVSEVVYWQLYIQIGHSVEEDEHFFSTLQVACC